jgi:medium-chain acyl-[acyl-carrier-protein] hydrolase
MTTRWLVGRKPNRRAGVRLFCFPYAGGGGSIFRSWQRSLSDAVEVCPVELPGRGSRITEPPFTNMAQLVRVATQALSSHLDQPFAFFGHSMGALIAFELARHLRREYNSQPVHFFGSGRCSPQTSRESLNPDLPQSELLEMLRRYNGTREEVLEDPELIELMLPVFRADLALCKSYVYTSERPFNFPITAFGGLEDYGVSRECIEGWREHTIGPFVVRMVPGDHFFLNSSTLLLLEAISKELEQDMRGKRA